eukprot:1136684-Pelagomonas_calceolata.AAC.2
MSRGAYLSSLPSSARLDFQGKCRLAAIGKPINLASSPLSQCHILMTAIDQQHLLDRPLLNVWQKQDRACRTADQDGHKEKVEVYTEHQHAEGEAQQ